MILKIAKKNLGQEYFIMDGVKNITYEKFASKQDESKAIDSCFIFGDDFDSRHHYDFRCKSAEAPPINLSPDAIPPFRGERLLIVELNTGTFAYIAIDSTAYLMNDNGKTIETIYC